MEEAVWLRCAHFLYDATRHCNLDNFHIEKKPIAPSHCSHSESQDDCPSVSSSDHHDHNGHEQLPELEDYELFEASTVQEIMAKKYDIEEIIDFGFISSEEGASTEQDIKRKPV